MNADRTEAALARRALKERWSLAEFLQELRRQFPDTAPAPIPPSPTNEIPGTLEKGNVMQARLACGYAACHPRDPRIENGRLVIQVTVNDNGGDTEQEERDETEVRRERQERLKKKADCDPAMTEKLERIDELLERIRARRGNGQGHSA